MIEAIHSERLQAGLKTYFFDIRRTREGGKYLQITESRLKEDGTRRRSGIAIFEDHFNNFKRMLGEMMRKR